MYLYVPISDSYVLALLCYSYVTRMYLFVPVCHSFSLGVLETMKENQCSLAEAMRLSGVPRNTLRDFIGICELRIIDKEKYERVVQLVKEKTGKVSMKLIESKCREALSDYRA